MIESGIVVFLAFWLLWIKLNIITRLRALNHPFLLDLTITAAVFLMFGGTGAGLLAASLAGVIMSINISIARKWFGYIYRDTRGELAYHAGRWNQIEKIHAEIASTR